MKTKTSVQEKESVRGPTNRGGRCRIAHPRTILVLVMLAAGAGCQLTAPETKVEFHDEGDIGVNAEQLRLRMRSLVDPLCGIVEQAADTIIAAAADRGVRRNALLWKIEAVPSLRESLYQPNPYTALLDTWVLSYQMIDYFQTGRGQETLGGASGIALTACQRIEREVEKVAVSGTHSKDVSDLNLIATEWAAEHPIQHSVADRESTLSRAVEREIDEAFTARGAIANLTTSVDDVNRRLEVYSDQLLNQARWQAELFAMDMAAEYQVDRALPLLQNALGSLDRALAAAERMVPAAERSVAAVEKAPQLIAAEREAALGGIHGDLLEALKFFHEERLAVLASVATERAELVTGLHEAITEERKILTEAIDGISSKVVDQAFFRAAQLVAGVLIALLIAFVGSVLPEHQ